MQIVVGDRVRLIHGREEGIVVRIVDARLIEVAIDNDFVIPVLAKEVAKIAREEVFFKPNEPQTKQSNKLHSPEQSQEVKAKLLATKGLFLALVKFGSSDCDVFLINNTEIHYLYTFHEYPSRNPMKNELKGVSHGQLAPHSFEKIKNIAGFNPSLTPAWYFEMIAFNKGYYIHPTAIQCTFILQQHNLATPVFVAALKGAAFLFQLDQTIAPKIDAKRLQERLMGHNEAPKPNNDLVKNIEKPALIIDLHADALGINNLPVNEILPKQLSIFQKKLDEAIVHKAEKITFIHGVGNGILRNALQKVLSKHPHIQTFKDSQKERFGYGALDVYIK